MLSLAVPAVQRLRSQNFKPFLNTETSDAVTESIFNASGLRSFEKTKKTLVSPRNRNCRRVVLRMETGQPITGQTAILETRRTSGRGRLGPRMKPLMDLAQPVTSDVRIDFRGTDAGMAEQFLDYTQIRAMLQ